MIKLSIIIPTLDAARPLTGCLAALGTAGGVPTEVIVSDGGSADDTISLAMGQGANVVLGPPGRGAQLRRGAAQASGEWLLFLHADSQLPDDWAEVLDAHMADAAGGAACFRLTFRAAGLAPRIVAAWANLRSLLGLPYGDQALLIRASDYHDIGGYPDQPLMEDVVMARRLRGKIRLLDATLSTGAEKYLAEGWFWRGAKNLMLLARYKLGADPKMLAKAYSRGSAPSDEN